MRVVIQMTGRAIATGLDFKNRIYVTIDAGGFAVRRAQHELRAAIVIKNVLFPACAGVAGLAFCSVVTLVTVILEVTGDTFHVHCIYIVERVFAMAIDTA